MDQGHECSKLTINAQLILKMRDIIFFAGKLHNGPFQVCPKPKKNNVPNFQKSAVHWCFYVPTELRRTLNELRGTLNELRGTLKIMHNVPCHLSCADPT